MLFYPDNQELTLFKLGRGGYKAVHPTDADRLAIPELEVSVGLVDGWVRFWFRGSLSSTPRGVRGQEAVIRSRLDAIETRLTATEGQLDAERAARVAAEAELARLREELGRAKGTAE